jgi:hypothetical protein
MELAPIALFVYNRPEHTIKTLDALSQCELASESDLYIFADGPKENASKENIDKIQKVNEVINGVKWAKNIYIERKQTNLGLAKSIVAGVTALCNKFGRVIVLEDDLLVSRYFLTYMNSSLEKYKDCSNVYQISGFMYPVSFKSKDDAFFLHLTTTWGWGTWDRAWKLYDWNPKDIQEKIQNKAIMRRFDLNGAYPYSKMLIDRMNGKNDSWGILWWWAVYNANGLVLHPVKTFVANIGFDGTGTHCGKSGGSFKSIITDFAGIKLPLDIKENSRCFRILRKKLKKGLLSKILKLLRLVFQFK